MCKYIYILLFLFSFSAQAQNKTSELTPAAATEEKKDFFNLTAYEPFYFLYNSDTSKVQASFKFKIAKDINLFLGYTHLLFWQLNKDSMPLKDVNYNPELFYRFEKVKHLGQIDMVGLGHKSNGKEGLESRSYNYVGVNLSPRFDIRKNISLSTRIKFRYIFAAEENKDLMKYISPVEFQGFLNAFSYGVVEKAQLNFRVYPGGNFGEHWGRGGEEIGISFRIRGLEITPSFYLQYFQGYAENLLEYNQFQQTFRAGILL